MRRRWKSTVARWVCTVLASGLAVVLVASLLWEGAVFSYGPSTCGVVVGRETLVFAWMRHANEPSHLETEFGRAKWNSGESIPWFPFHDTMNLFGVRGPDLVYVPLWMPFALTAAPSGYFWWREVKRRRDSRFRVCTVCGYDRVGLADEAKCPECGKSPR